MIKFKSHAELRFPERAHTMESAQTFEECDSVNQLQQLQYKANKWSIRIQNDQPVCPLHSGHFYTEWETTEKRCANYREGLGFTRPFSESHLYTEETQITRVQINSRLFYRH